MNPKIKVEADLSSAQSEVESFRKELAQLKQEMDSPAGKTKFEQQFNAAGDALNKLLAQYDKLQDKLDKVEKSGKRYADILKQVGKLTEDAAKLASKMENMGSLSNTNRSSYFRDESSALHSEQFRIMEQMRQDALRSQQEAQNKVNQDKMV